MPLPENKGANDVTSLAFIGLISDSNGVNYSASDVDVIVKNTSYGGSDEESVESIKYNAPDSKQISYHGNVLPTNGAICN